MPAVAMKAETIEKSLKQLVPLIKRELAYGHAAGAPHFREAGRLLIQAKARCKKEGQLWIPWLARNFRLHKRTAQSYMAGVRLEKRTRVRFSTLAETKPKATARIVPPQWHEPVEQITGRIDMEVLAQEEQARQTERYLIQQIAIQIIDIGYKVLAVKFHPDKPGGSDEAMTRLGAARDLLKKQFR